MTYYAECITFKENDKQMDHQDKQKTRFRSQLQYFSQLYILPYHMYF